MAVNIALAEILRRLVARVCHNIKDHEAFTEMSICRIWNSNWISSQRDNIRPHTARTTLDAFANLEFQIVPRPS